MQPSGTHGLRVLEVALITAGVWLRMEGGRDARGVRSEVCFTVVTGS